MNQKKRNLIVVVALILTSLFSLNTSIYADDGEVVIGKTYILDADSNYEYKNKEYILRQDDNSTYGKFKLKGNVTDVSENEGDTVYEIGSDNVSFSYTYGDKLLKATDDNWHLVKDKGKRVNDIELSEKIQKGTIILQTSIDKKNWLTEVEKTNVFESIPIETKDFYSTNNVQLTNGCYYRITVAYELERKVGTDKILWLIPKDEYEYEKHVEIYEFYLVNQDANFNQDDKNQKYSLGEKTKTNGNGFVGQETIKKDDPHYGWDIGNFFVSGYTAKETDIDGKDVFLKNAGDKVTLWFNLQQNIDRLNEIEGLSIYSDDYNYDQYFETPRTDFGRGTLIVRYTDHENVKHEPTIYKNYLVANTTLGTDTKVQLFDEGDYEVALDYVIESDSKVLGVIPNSKETHYRIFFKFSVRNGNCMAFPMDIKTNQELSNTSITKNGFKLDLAKSRYLDINVKREVLNEGANGLIEDVRSNRPAKQGDVYTDEGIYTITVKNKYTDQTTEKVIYVGTNKLLKAYVKNGLPIADIQEQLELGAEIKDDGTLTSINYDTELTVNENEEGNNIFLILIILAIICTAIVIVYFVQKNKKEKRNVQKEEVI